jgi:hypothetical protein
LNYSLPNNIVIYRGAPFGLFANVYTVLGLLDLYKKNKIGGLKVECEWNCLYSDNKNDNFWEYCFEKIDLKNGDYKIIEFDYNFLGLMSIHGRSLNLIYANELCKKYIKPKLFILNEVFKFQKENFDNKYIIGLHYRGADKIIESPMVSIQYIIQNLNKIINGRKDFKIFVATDEKYILDKLIDFYDFHKIIYQKCTRCLEKDRNGIHNINEVKGSLKMQEALIDSLLLSTCHEIIKTESNLSAFSSVWNPYLQTLDATKHYIEAIK